MELRHLRCRCFLAVAEELHFARAAERLYIEQSPLSRAVKALEEELGVVLLARTTRSTRLAPAGNLLLDLVRRLFAGLQQARESVKVTARGFTVSCALRYPTASRHPACWRYTDSKNSKSKSS